MKYKKILIATDLSAHSNATLRVTMEIFERADHITVITVINPAPIPLIADYEFPSQLLRDFREDSLKNATSALEDSCRAYTEKCRREVIVSSDPPAEVITHFAEKNQYDLIVIGSHGAGRFTNLFVGTTALKIIKLATCPIMLVPEKMIDSIKNHHGEYSLSNFLIGTDLSKTSRKFLQPFADNLEGNEGITLLVVLERLLYPMCPEGAVFLSAELEKSLAERIPHSQKELEMIGELYFQREHKVAVKLLESNDNIGKVISEYAAEHESDVIVLGSHGQGAVANLFIGSTVQDVLKLAPCPVLVFPTKLHE